MDQALEEHRKKVRAYYDLLETALGFRFVMGNTRHFGYYPNRRSSPFPLSRGLREMEQQVFEGLDLPPGARVLDAGCGSGHVAAHMANNGLSVLAIDITDRHLRQAREFVTRHRLNDKIEIVKLDYHDLSSIAPNSLDGAYTVETFVHSVDPLRMMKGVYRVLKPGGVLLHSEYEHMDHSKAPKSLPKLRDTVELSCPLPGYSMFEFGAIGDLLREAGFVDVEYRDITENVLPMLRLFYWLTIIPFFLVKLLRMEKHLPHLAAGAGWLPEALNKRIKSVHVKARKPFNAK